MRRQIIEGVLAIVRLDTGSLSKGKVNVQVFDRRGGAGNVQFNGKHHDLTTLSTADPFQNMPILILSLLRCSSTMQSRPLKPLNRLRQHMATTRLFRTTLNPLQTLSHQHQPPSPITSPTLSRPSIQARSHSYLAPCRSRTMLLNTLKLRQASTPILHAFSHKSLVQARTPASARLPSRKFQHLASLNTQHSPPCLEANLKALLHLSKHQRNNPLVALI